MKAVIWTKYGAPEVLQLREVEKPTPKDNEVLIKIYATTVLIGDCELRSFKLPILYRIPIRLFLGVTNPKRVTILGQELAGEIEAVGRAVTRFKVGDEVFAPTQLRLGAYAEYECLPESYPAIKPPNISYEIAATLPTGGVYGIHLLRVANIRAGEKVLIFGAGGSIGTYAVQIAKVMGAEVTGLDSTEKLNMLRSIGADHVIDYTKENFTKSDQKYDVIIDVVGKSPFSGSLRALTTHGRYVLGNPGLIAQIRSTWTSMTSEKRVINDQALHRTEYYIELERLIEAGKVTPAIDRSYPLEQIAEAHRYVDTGQKRGNVVITVAHNS